MKHTQTKFFITFLAGILFSAVTVFAATVNVSTNFTSNAVQYLQKLVVTDSNGVTGVTLKWVTSQINVNKICNSGWSECKDVDELVKAGDVSGDGGIITELDPEFMSLSWAFLRENNERDVSITGELTVSRSGQQGQQVILNWLSMNFTRTSASYISAINTGWYLIFSVNWDEWSSSGAAMIIDKDKNVKIPDGSLSVWSWATANWNYSVSMWYNTVAKWEQSFAIWYSTTASWNHAVAMWAHTQANWYMSTAMGYWSEAHWAKSTAMWNRTDAYWENSVAMGWNTITATWATSSLTIWKFNTPIGNALFVIGKGNNNIDRSNAMVVLNDWNTTINGALSADSISTPGTLEVGANTQALWNNSVAIGSNTIAVGSYSTAMGYQTETTSHNSLVIWKWNTVVTSSLFVIGNGDDGNRGNAMVVLDNWDTTINGMLKLTKSEGDRCKNKDDVGKITYRYICILNRPSTTEYKRMSKFYWCVNKSSGFEPVELGWNERTNITECE